MRYYPVLITIQLIIVCELMRYNGNKYKKQNKHKTRTFASTTTTTSALSARGHACQQYLKILIKEMVAIHQQFMNTASRAIVSENVIWPGIGDNTNKVDDVAAVDIL